MTILNLRRLTLRCVAVLALVALISPVDGLGATRTVTSLKDSGTGTLRSTVAVSAAGDTIVFNPGLAGTILLTSGELAIGRDLTILGPASGLTVSGNNASRVFNISGGTVHVSNLIIRDGRVVGAAGGQGLDGAAAEGGGILNQADLNLTNCTFINNSSWGGKGGDAEDLLYGPSAGGAGTGGAIHNRSILRMTDCTLNGNSTMGGNGGYSGLHYNGGLGGSASGGAIYNLSVLTMINCTLSGNAITGGSGGDTQDSFGGTGGYVSGGGVSDSGGRGTYLNTVIANNVVSGGAGGLGLFANGANGSAIGPDVSGSVSSQGHNLIGKSDGSSGWVETDLTGTIAASLDPLLGPLQNNGGPTPTMALLPGSAAIDSGDDAVLGSPLALITDQRGRPRRFDAHVDIGAYELSGPATLTVVNTDDSGFGSLRQAIQDIDPQFSDTITFEPSVAGTITLTSGKLTIGRNVTILGPGAKVLTVSGNDSNSVFHVTNGVTLISGLRIANGHAASSDGGGVVLTGGFLTLSNCTITDCYNNFGGGIEVLSGSLIVIASTIQQNRGAIGGGGIWISLGGTASLVGSTVSGNSTFDTFLGNAGGGIYVFDGRLTLNDSTVANNNSTGRGGGILCRDEGSVFIHNSLVAGNTAPTSPDCWGTFISRGYNLIGNSEGSSGFGSMGDQANLNPMIGPLQDNGGPTFTHGLLPGSPAIDKGKGDSGSDQRGGARPVDISTVSNSSGGEGSDIGAFEVDSLFSIISITRSATVARVKFKSDPGFTYTLQRKNTLTNVPWTNVVSVQGNGQVLEAIDSSPLPPTRFYRIGSQY